MKQGSNINGKSHVATLNKYSANYQAELLLQGLKDKAGAVIQVAITRRTTIELPANLTMEEREARIANYIELHKSKI